MKRKVEVVHLQEHCDEWLSTRNRKKVKPAKIFPKRSRSLKVRLTNSSPWQLTLNSQPPPKLKTSTRQSSLLRFFKSPVSSQQSQREDSNVEVSSPRETTLTALRADCCRHQPVTSQRECKSGCPQNTSLSGREHASDVSVRSCMCVDGDKENISVSLSCDSVCVGKEHGKNKTAHEDLASVCLPIINKPRSALTSLHENTSDIRPRFLSESRHLSSSLQDKPRPNVSSVSREDEQVDYLGTQTQSVTVKPRSPHCVVNCSKMTVDKVSIQSVCCSLDGTHGEDILHNSRTRHSTYPGSDGPVAQCPCVVNSESQSNKRLGDTNTQARNLPVGAADSGEDISHSRTRQSTDAELKHKCHGVDTQRFHFSDSSYRSPLQGEECHGVDTQSFHFSDWSLSQGDNSCCVSQSETREHHCLGNRLHCCHDGIQCQNALHCYHGDIQCQNRFNCCQGGSGLNCCYGNATPCFQTEATVHFSDSQGSEVSFHSSSWQHESSNTPTLTDDSDTE